MDESIAAELRPFAARLPAHSADWEGLPTIHVRRSAAAGSRDRLEVANGRTPAESSALASALDLRANHGPSGRVRRRGV